mmetsp:Transcript_2374/g.6934  ORF Transcript_2374/g.6934 Transcript_2374/m.6934 type:complete len:155 (-) Transcript_2374:230-694(-)
MPRRDARHTFPAMRRWTCRRAGVPRTSSRSGRWRTSRLAAANRESDSAGGSYACGLTLLILGQSYLKIIDPKNLCKEEITAEDSEEWVALLAIECRGLEPVAWLPKPGDFTVTTTGGSVFQEVEFDDGIWAEYDAEADEPVSINELTSTFEVCR